MAPLLVGIGEATVELVGVAPWQHDRANRVELEQVSVQGGGGVATALVAAASLGLGTRLFAKVADDDLGHLILGALAGAGVDVSFVKRDAGRLSPFAFRAIPPDHRARETYFTRGDVGPIAPTEVDVEALLAGADALLVSTSTFDEGLGLAAAERCRTAGVPVILDARLLNEGMGELVALSDHMIASDRFASEVAPRGEVEDALRELQRMGPRGVVITQGAAGSVGLFGDTLVHQPAFPAQVVDVSGAGEVYRGAFASALLLGFPEPRCMAFASAAAALACTALGPQGRTPDLDEVKRFLGWR